MSRINELLAYRPPDEVTVTLPRGEVFKFRCPQTRAQILELQARSEMLRTAGENLPREWQQYEPIAPETYAEILILAENYIGDDMTTLDWVRLQHEAGLVFSFIYQQYMLAISEIVTTTTKQSIDQAKKN